MGAEPRGAGLSVGQRVGRLRETFGLSRAQVADAVGRNPEWLRTLEAGRQRIDGVDLRPLPADRRARHGIDRARALARAGDAAGAAAELLAADRVGSPVVRTHPLVGELLRTAPTRATAEAAAALGVHL